MTPIAFSKLRPFNAATIVKLAVTASVGAAFLYGDLVLFRRLFAAVAEVEKATPFFALGLLRSLIALVFLIAVTILFSSSMTAAIGAFFADLDLDTYHAAPMPKTTLVLERWFKTFAQSATIVYIFIVPMFVAFAQRYRAPASFYPVVLINLALLLAIPVTLGALVILVLVRPYRRIRGTQTSGTSRQSVDVRARRVAHARRGAPRHARRGAPAAAARAPLHPQVRLLHRPQGHRSAVRLHGALLPPPRLLPHDPHAAAARVAPAGVQRDEADRGHARAGRRAPSRGVQPARGHARHDHDLLGYRAAGRRRVRELPRPAADRRPRHGLPEAQHGQLLVLLRRRRDHAVELLLLRRHGQLRLDLVPAALRHRHARPDLLALRHGLPHHLVAPRLRQLPRDDHSAAGEGDDADALPLLRLGAVRDLVPPAAGLPAARGGRGAADDGPPGGDELLPPVGARRQRPGPPERRRRQPAPVAASLLVPGPPRGVRLDPAGHGHHRRDHRQQHAQAAVGVSLHGRRRHLPRVHVLRGLGAPHVSDRDGHGHQRLLPDHDDDHLHPFGHRLERALHLVVGRVDPLQHPDALRARLPADVRHRRSDGTAAGTGDGGPAPARHLLRHRALPLRRRAGDDLRHVRRRLLLVPEDQRPAPQRVLGQSPLLDLARLHQRHLLPDVHAGPGGRVAPAL